MTYLVIIGLFLQMAQLCGIYRLIVGPRKTLVCTPIESSMVEESINDDGGPFVVSGKPKKPSIAQRKKELREAAKTKRKKMEEWRD